MSRGDSKGIYAILGGYMTTWYREWAEQPNRRRGRMVKDSDIPKLIKNLKDPGYCSIYMFNQTDADEIKETGSSKGLGKYEVGASCLTMDIDRDTLKDAQECMSGIVSKLEELGLAFEVWFSGGKGFHVIIPHEFLTSEHLPNSHKQVVVSWGFDVDMSLYQHGRILSLPGRIHPKTGKRKELVRKVEGNLLTFDIVKKSEPIWNFVDTDKDLRQVFNTLSWLCETDPKNGQRHTLLWGVAKDLCGVGITIDTALDLLQSVNKKWSIPKTEDEVIRAVKQGYGHGG